MLTNSNRLTDIENKLVVISEEREMGRMSQGMEWRDKLLCINKQQDFLSRRGNTSIIVY